MLDNSYSSSAGSSHEAGDLLPICLFLNEHGVALEVAAGLLGGDRWARRVLKLRQNVRAGGLPRRPCMMELHALSRLLRLEHVSDPGAEESAYFAVIDPRDPRVHDICLLTDRLDRCLVEISECKRAGRLQGDVAT